MKRLSFIGLVLAAILTVALLGYRDGGLFSDRKKPQVATGEEQGSRTGEDSVPGTPVAKGNGKTGTAPMRPVQYLPDPEALAKRRQEVPYKLLGSGASGRIVDREGHVLLATDKDIIVISASVSPNNARILARGGDAVNYVLTPSSGVRIKLPFAPPGDNLFPLSDWQWIDDHNLLGISGVRALDTNGQPVKTDNNIAQTKLYVYRVATRTLEEITLPSELTQSVLTIPEIGAEGQIHVYSAPPNGGEEQDHGWFTINTSKSPAR